MVPNLKRPVFEAFHRLGFEKYKTHVGRMASWYIWPAGKNYPSTGNPLRTSVLFDFSSYENIKHCPRVPYIDSGRVKSAECQPCHCRPIHGQRARLDAAQS